MLKTIFNCKSFNRFEHRVAQSKPIKRLRSAPAKSLQWSVLLVVWATTISMAQAALETTDRTTQRLAQVVDYVAADYAGAVRNGQVLVQSEYNEQRELLTEGKKLVAEIPGSDADRAALSAELLAIIQLVDARASEVEVQRQCRAVRKTLKDTFHLRLVPTGMADAKRGAQLFSSLCTSCHGATGRADTPAAAALKPPPLSFHDDARMAKVSPTLAYHALTAGISGTAMAPFDSLSAQDRWNLAFYVVALRHGQPGETAQTDWAKQLPPALRDPVLLAELSDEELAAEVAKAGGSPAALAYLRASAPFGSPGASEPDPFARARMLVTEVLAAAQKGDFAAAHRLSIAAYLDGIEPHEASLRIDRPDLLSRLELAFAGLRQATDPERGASAVAAASKAQIIEALLAEAEHSRAAAGGAGATRAFLASLVIALREGLEVALLIAALLAFLRKSGQATLAHSVHLGWLLSIPAGLVTFLLVGKLIDGASRELAEGILTLVAAAILLSVTHWLLGAKEARHWLGFLRRRIEAAGQGGQGQRLVLFGIAFFAAYREALETALFYRALLLDVGPAGFRPVIMGVLVGALALIALVLIVGRIGRKLNPRPVMLASSALLSLLALVLTGHGVHALQEGGYLGLSLISIGGHSWSGMTAIGLYPTWQGIAAQAFALGLLILPWVLEKLRAARVGSESGSLPHPSAT